MARWLALTREVLPGMPAAARWPIRYDHCFMRVFLDHAMQGPWHHSVRRPAIRHMENAALARAVALAERAVVNPGDLPVLNRASLKWRKEGSKA